ncbi:MAG: hypothetical protein K9G40_07540 [Crocinitomicaceae bacterium]|nr:hypothetical protein [Crocinitomicaceae bacterium]MCF8434384.1 hypothetical protein [Crocinitomicaceae bacterium]
MKRLISIIFLLICNLTFAQDIDTSFVIKTKNSEIKVVCKRSSQNGSSQSMLLLIATIKINQTTIDEAEKSGIKTGKCYVNLHYNSNCGLDSISTLRASKNSSFNNEVVLYFKEFIDAYNRNNLKKYFSESTTECGGNKLIFSYYVE